MHLLGHIELVARLDDLALGREVAAVQFVAHAADDGHRALVEDLAYLARWLRSAVGGSERGNSGCLADSVEGGGASLLVVPYTGVGPRVGVAPAATATGDVREVADELPVDERVVDERLEHGKH